MNAREFLALAPLAVLCLWIGVQPASVIEMIQPDIKPIVAVIDKFRTGVPSQATVNAVAETSIDGSLTVTATTP